MPRSREEDFLGNTQILHFLPKIISQWGKGSRNLQFLAFLHYRCYIPNTVKIGPVVLEKTILANDGHQPIVTGYLSVSGDPKNVYEWEIHKIFNVLEITCVELNPPWGFLCEVIQFMTGSPSLIWFWAPYTSSAYDVISMSIGLDWRWGGVQ